MTVVKRFHEEDSEQDPKENDNDLSNQGAARRQGALPWESDLTASIAYLQNEQDNDYESLKTVVEGACESFLDSNMAQREVERLALQGASSVFATVVIKNKKDPRLNEAKQKELRELVSKGTYEFVREEEVPLDATVLQSRFVLTIKNFGENNEYFKVKARHSRTY